jgi:hypothetical protein
VVGALESLFEDQPISFTGAQFLVGGTVLAIGAILTGWFLGGL